MRLPTPRRGGHDTGGVNDGMAQLVTAAQEGDEEAFVRLYRHLQPSLLRYLSVLVGDDAEDVSSEAWLQITRDLHRFSGSYTDFRGWAVTVARHRALDHLRQARRRPSISMPVDAFASLADNHDTAALSQDAMDTRDAVQLICALPREQAEAVLLRVVMGLDAPAAGRVLGRRAGAVRTATHRGLRRLAALLQTPAGTTEQLEKPDQADVGGPDRGVAR